MKMLMRTAKRIAARLISLIVRYAAYTLKRASAKPHMLAALKTVCISAVVMYFSLTVYSKAFFGIEREAIGSDSESGTVEAAMARVVADRHTEENNLDLEDEKLKLLAAFIMSEAGDKPYLVKLGVGAVVVNRMNTDGFPDTLTENIRALISSGEAETASFDLLLAEADDSSYNAAYSVMHGADPTFEAVYYTVDGTEKPTGTRMSCIIYGVKFYTAAY